MVSDMVTETMTTGELLKGQTLMQAFVSESDMIDSITILGATYGRINTDELHVVLTDEQDRTLAETDLSTAQLADASRWTFSFQQTVQGCKNKLLTLTISSKSGVPGNAVTLFYGKNISSGKFEVAKPVDYQLLLNEQSLDGELCLSVNGTVQYKLADYYWYAAAAVSIVLLAFCAKLLFDKKQGKDNFFLQLMAAMSKYRFLLKQLVARDFKTKYKRSVLGILWSLINPLLTMLVMYIVFSKLFVSNIPNFPAYLLTGIICWNYFSESTSMCLTSITGNASLITKVYVPKYMYPCSRLVSSLVNFGLSLIPLFIVLIITRTAFTVQFLLLPFPIICLFLFSLGIGLLLASGMVFFRDTQFLWGIISMLWMYLTPIFYSDSIIPSALMSFYKMNPLYHIVRVFRVILINGASPEPKAYLLCFAASVIPFIIGALVFKKTQDRFVLYL